MIPPIYKKNPEEEEEKKKNGNIIDEANLKRINLIKINQDTIDINYSIGIALIANADSNFTTQATMNWRS